MATLISTNSQSTFKTVIDTLLADINAVVPNFSSLVSSYRLLVGSAEEIHRTPGVSPEIVVRAIERYDRTGTLIDIIIDLLCCKVTFVSDLLSVTGGPIDLIRLLGNRIDVAETPHQVAENVLLLEVLRRAEECLRAKGFSTENSDIRPTEPPETPPVTFPTSLYHPPAPPACFPPQEPLPPLFEPPATPAAAPTAPAPSAKISKAGDNAAAKRSQPQSKPTCPCRPRKLK
ncbi:MAG: hypothetical protein H6Q67_255 [Firmicutes bacterium]|nr:hypothetical protein [Bacillota bacterium]